mmetsp:Transcript_37174/g.72514  ORF Transcript_37174/g.72514 Transcript_37174/m.72514 type:complete len:131 (-) Transcript_37174:221-613(-)|eukprot:CAMPEP_0173394340 /NCGR_PEP_ID=MMETSP1356-20130122/26943_1 /TAXON_ID=77927 ORGANISM="Hemiselmis virescens, Strain PCC157" /NCGR_SAMPLE_ID=MMETSP1356 /ASSEMBLY_ACC=CAM_ASM_000847 /LENGTH=130 /DNA_ID=CAMNT_0014352671 /DNA_START=36 /DNA_END=428 /DNA_ORIENTATION=+
MATATYECLCKTVGYEVTGEPAMACFCHCNHCQIYGGDAAHVAAFKPEQFKYTKGESETIVYEHTPKKTRHTCKKCGSFVHNILPNGLMVTPLGGMTFTKDKIKPTMHIFYAERCRDATDDLPKHEGWPA